MSVMPGLFEFLIIVFIVLWKAALPLAVIYILARLWHRLRAVEKQVTTMASSPMQEKFSPDNT
ncbi:MAG: hypothetical protein R2867_01955 [Caldilineaceae bacterium]